MSASDTSSTAARAHDLSPAAWLGRAFAILLLIVFALFFVVPLVWLLIAPTKTDRQLLLEAPFAFGSIDTLVANWSSLVTFQGGLIWTWIGNSAFYCLAALAISLVVSIPAGYALALTEFRGRRALLVATLIVMLVPSTALALPIFLELSAVRLIGNPLAAILPFSFFPFGVYLTYIYFSTAISRDLLDAARIDGASEVQVFMRIAMPLATPVIALVGFFNFTGNWNNYFLPYVMLSDQNAYNLPVGLGALMAGSPALHPERGGSFLPITRPEVALAGLIVVVPIACLFVIFQRYLVRGILSGSVKS